MAYSRGALALMAVALLAGLAFADPALAQKSGGTLRTYNSTNPPSASIMEEATIATAMAFSAVFNNLLIFDQSKPRNGLDTIVPELAESWAWDEPRTSLTVKLRRGVRWHDGKEFTARDVQCTWHKILGRHPDELRGNPRGVWWSNLKEVTVNGDFEATFVLGRPQASFPALLASNLSPVYPCHVPAKEMRRRPIGTGPFKFVSFDFEPVDQARQEPGLLEARPAVSRRHRDEHHRQPLDARPRVRGQGVRPDLRCRHHGAADLPTSRRLAHGHLRAGADRGEHQPPRQPQQAPLRQRQAAQGHGSGPRQTRHHRHPVDRQGDPLRRHDGPRPKAGGECPRRW